MPNYTGGMFWCIKTIAKLYWDIVWHGGICLPVTPVYPLHNNSLLRDGLEPCSSHPNG